MESATPTADGRVVVIGASAGGVEALAQLVSHLPADFGLPIFVVLHVPPTTSFLPQILDRAGPLRAEHAKEGDAIEPGRILIAPPDNHLILGGHEIHLNRGPRENGHRPAVDPLFRSAVAQHGDRVVGVVLSGSLDDGTVGLSGVKREGGITIVQDPEEAVYPSMPQSAIDAAQPDHVLPIREIARLLVSLDGQPSPGQAQSKRRKSRCMPIRPSSRRRR